ncbi:MAG TPA: 30S ribosomal protein S16 [Planctomycetota bacterium]|nr:30S ribosomal protein S16 [Planctomycetota bacterium]
MAARIRLKRIGRKNRPAYRICVFDARTRRDGAPIEELGSYNPQGKSIDDKVVLDKVRALHWLSVGAQPSDTVASFFRKLGVRKGQPLPAAPAPAAGPA